MVIDSTCSTDNLASVTSLICDNGLNKDKDNFIGHLEFVVYMTNNQRLSQDSNNTKTDRDTDKEHIQQYIEQLLNQRLEYSRNNVIILTGY